MVRLMRKVKTSLNTFEEEEVSHVGSNGFTLVCTF